MCERADVCVLCMVVSGCDCGIVCICVCMIVCMNCECVCSLGLVLVNPFIILYSCGAVC